MPCNKALYLERITTKKAKEISKKRAGDIGAKNLQKSEVICS